MLDIAVPFVCSLEEKKKTLQGQEGFVKQRLCLAGKKKKKENLMLRIEMSARQGEKKVLLAQRGSLQEA